MKNEDTYKLIMIVLIILVIILGGYFYMSKIRDLDKTILEIQNILPYKESSITLDTLINKEGLLNALTDEERQTNFSSIVKNVNGYDVEYVCEAYNDVDGCNDIRVTIRPFHVQ